MGISGVNWLLAAMVAILVSGTLSGSGTLTLAATGLLVCATILQWKSLLPLARIFLCVAGVTVPLVLWMFGETGLQTLVTSAVQGCGFAALMLVVGMLRHPVRHSPRVQTAAAWLTAFAPHRRYRTIQTGTMFLSLLFNIGVLPMMGDLIRKNNEATITDPQSRAMMAAAMRGSAMVTVWSPLSLGFAIVSAGIPGLNLLAFLCLTGGFTLVALFVTSLLPLLPKGVSILPEPNDTSPLLPAPIGGGHTMAQILSVCAGLLLTTVTLHNLAGISFTIASVICLPLFALIWPRIEGGTSAKDDLRATLSGLSDMRNESAILMAANIVGSAIALGVVHYGLAESFLPSGAVLPVLLALLVFIPIAAYLYLPASVVIVIAAQVFGTSPLGQEHPLALALVLAVGWATGISGSPLTAMTLITGRYCGLPSREIGWKWNGGFILAMTTTAAAIISLLVLTGWG